MKKSLLIATSACLVAGSAFAATPKKENKQSMARQIAEYVKAINNGKLSANPLSVSTRSGNSLPDNIYEDDGSVVWCPGFVTDYYWNGQSWEGGAREIYTYNDNGQILTRGGETYRTEFKYDELSRVQSQTSKYFNGVEWVTDNVTSYTYDDVVKDLVVKTVSGSEWGSNEYGIEITRNADGNITEVKDYSAWDSQKSYSNVLTVKYGADGKANEIIESEYDNGRLIPDVTYSNVEWENTDGQIYEVEIDDYDADSYFGLNRIKHASVDDDEWPKTAELNVAYNDGNFGFHAVLAMEGNDVIYDYTYKPVDDFGSYDVSLVEVDWDDDDGVYYKDYTRTGTESYRVDKFGLMLQDISEGVDVDSKNSDPYYYGEKGAVTYDPTTGCPVEYIKSRTQGDSKNYVYSDRKVFGDYTWSAVENIVDDSDDAPIEYYNLHGVRVNNPDSGIFIRRQGNNSTKVLF